MGQEDQLLLSSFFRTRDGSPIHLSQTVTGMFLEGHFEEPASCYVRSKNATFVAMPGAPFVASERS